MPSWTVWIFLTALLARPACSTDQQRSFLEIPVAAKTVVPPEAYAAASTLAAGGSAPVDIALAVVGPFEGTIQHIFQANDAGEAPSAAQMTVIRDGLLDDAISAERWDIALDRTRSGCGSSAR